MTTEKKEEKNQVEVTARAFVDALIDVAMKNQSNKIEEAYNSIPVSYTHLTLPTICSV